MNPDPHLQFFAGRFLTADPTSLTWTDSGLEYRPSRLRVHLECERLTDAEDETILIRLRSDLVTGVRDPEFAEEVCAHFNRWTGSWSLAFDPDTKAVCALVSARGAAADSRPWLRLAEAATLASRVGEEIAPGLAKALGGTLGWSGETVSRHRPDPQFWWLEARRARPEWLLDPTRYLFPDPDVLARHLADGLPDTVDSLFIDQTGVINCTLTPESGETFILEAGFMPHALYGEGIATSTHGPRQGAAETAAALCTQLTWLQYRSPGTSLLGSWSQQGDELVYRQFWSTSGLRLLQSLPDFAGYDADELRPMIVTAREARHVLSDLPETRPDRGGQEPDRARTIASGLIESFLEPAREAMRAVPTPADQSHPDQRLLWAESREIINFGYFDPAGPAVHSLAVAPGPDGRHVLLHIRRHPFTPQYRCLGYLPPAEHLSAEFATIMTDIATSPPTFLDASACPGDLLPAVEAGLTAWAEALDRTPGMDLSGLTSMLRRHRTDPWGLADSRSEAAADPPAGDAGTRVRDWLAEITDGDNVVGQWLAIPDLWDAAVANRIAAGTLPDPQYPRLALHYPKGHR